MTKKKRIITRLLVVLAALTLISCCFLGSTFARYTTGKEGSATAGVAKWNASVAGSGTDNAISVDFDKLSPSKDAWASGVERKNTTEKVLVATVNNTDSEVDAKFEISMTDLALTTIDSTTADYDAAKAKSVFTIDLYYTTAETPTADDYKTMTSFTILAAGSTTTTSDTVFANATTVKIYAQLTWTTKDSGTDGTAGDTIDTMVGRNVTKVSTTIACTATQVTQIPA